MVDCFKIVLYIYITYVFNTKFIYIYNYFIYLLKPICVIITNGL